MVVRDTKASSHGCCVLYTIQTKTNNAHQNGSMPSLGHVGNVVHFSSNLYPDGALVYITTLPAVLLFWRI